MRTMHTGVDGLLRDKTRPSRKPPLDRALIARVVELTASDPYGEATHWTAAAMAKTTGISVSSVQRRMILPSRPRVARCHNKRQKYQVLATDILPRQISSEVHPRGPLPNLTALAIRQNWFRMEEEEFGSQWLYTNEP